MSYTIKRENIKFKHAQGLNEEKTNIASVSPEMCKNILEIYGLINERLRTTSDRLDFERVANISASIMKEKKEELARVKKLEDMKTNAGFTLISIIIILGIVGFSFITFLVIKGILD